MNRQELDLAFAQLHTTDTTIAPTSTDLAHKAIIADTIQLTEDELQSKIDAAVENVKMSILPIVADFDPNQEGYRRISGVDETQRLTLSAVDRYKMFQVADYMYTTSAFTKRCVEMDNDFLFGEEFTVEAEDQTVQFVLDSFIEQNRLKTDFPKKMKWLSLYGEQCYPVVVNSKSGAVELRYINPANIKDVLVKRDNVEQPIYVEMLGTTAKRGRIHEIIRVDQDPMSKTYDKLIGKCFFFAINHPPDAPRGISDYWQLFDWIDGFERQNFMYLERVELLWNFIWDVTVKGGKGEEWIRDYQRKNSRPKPATVRAHNDGIEWKAVSPQLNANDFSAGFEAIIGFIAACMGKPRNFFGQGGKLYSNEAEQQDQVPIKHFDTRQKEHERILKTMCDFAIDQAIIHKTIVGHKSRKTIEYKLTMPEVSKKNFMKGMSALPQAVTAITLAENQGYIDKDSARQMFVHTTEQIGYNLDIDTIEANIEKEKSEEPSTLDYDKI